MRTLFAFALVLGLLGGWSGDAGARSGTLAGSWFVEVIPQPAPPDVPIPPPRFVSILNFEFAKTLVETDTSVNPNSLVDFFPPDLFPAFSTSDGYGGWKRTGRNRYRCRFLKFMFDEEGLPIGIIDTTLNLTVRRDGRLEGHGRSDFVRGTDPEGEIFFTGPVIVEGSRLRVGTE